MAKAFVTTKQNYADFKEYPLKGEWITLDDFNDVEFQQACEKLYPESEIIITDLDEISHVYINPVVNTTFYTISENFWVWKELQKD